MASHPDSIGDWLERSSGDPTEVAEQYDAWARDYDDDLATWSYQAPQRVVATLLARQPEVDDVLDVGCGTGLVGRTLRGRGYAGRLTGLDLSAASLDLAREGGAYDDVQQADLQQRLPLADGEAGAVVCVGVMTYLPDVEAVWRELARVTRPGGHVVITQRDDLWTDRGCQDVVDRLQREEIWDPVEVSGPAPYLPEGYGDGQAVACYYLTTRRR